MAGFYSMVVLATDEVAVPEHHLFIEEGINTFNVQLDDPAAFCLMLQEHGCVIHAFHKLDDHEDSSEWPALPV